MASRSRRFIQMLSALLYNANLSGFVSGTIYRGKLKGLCVPGLNCYSCPGAIAACPLGSLQSALGGIKHKLPLYAVGMLLLFGTLLGRGVCAYLCPFGLIQELLYKIPSPKLKKSRATRLASLGKYVFLTVFVLILPLYYLLADGVGVPAFCKYICPAGTLEGGLPLVLVNGDLRAITGALFNWKLAVLVLVIAGSIFVYRGFCRFICPLGAIYSLLNKYAIFGIRVDKEQCTGCGSCVKTCKLDTYRLNDRECIRCGDCRHACKHGAIYVDGTYRTKKLRHKKG